LAGDFSVAELLRHCQQTQRPVCFGDLWTLLQCLDDEGFLLQPRLTEWQGSLVRDQIQKMAAPHLGIHERVTVAELKLIPFFRNLREEVLQTFAENSSVHNVAAGLYLCQQGGADRHLFMILKGQAMVVHQNQRGERFLLARSGVGSILGEGAFFLGLPRSADVIMAEDGQFLQINFSESFEAMIRSEKAVILKERFQFLTALLKSPLFSSLDAAAFDALLKAGAMVQLAAGQILFKEGQVSDHFYVVVQGSVVVSQAGVSINVLGPGASLGEMAMYQQGYQRTASVTAQSPSLLMAIPYQAFLELLFNHLSLAMLMEAQAVERRNRDLKRKSS
jgi:CRP-like cAMP-binding protein